MNGIDIHVSESEFKSKTPSEQSWMVFKAIETATLCIEEIDVKGCVFSRDRHLSERKTNWKSSIIIAAGSFGGVAASVFAVWKYVLCK